MTETTIGTDATADADIDATADAETAIEAKATDETESADEDRVVDPAAMDTASPTDTDPASPVASPRATPTDTDPLPVASPRATPTGADLDPSPVESELRTRLCHPRLATSVARGSRHRSGYLPSCTQAPKPILVPVLYADLYDQFVELLATCPEFAAGLHPDGHGGLDNPHQGTDLPAQRRNRRPGAGARPTLSIPQLQRARRAMPTRPHRRVRPNDNPEAGGWTIESNLECVCAYNHELETVGLWHARALPGMAILWTGPRGDRHLTLPAGGLSPVPAAPDL